MTTDDSSDRILKDKQVLYERLRYADPGAIQRLYARIAEPIVHATSLKLETYFIRQEIRQALKQRKEALKKKRHARFLGNDGLPGGTSLLLITLIVKSIFYETLFLPSVSFLLSPTNNKPCTVLEMAKPLAAREGLP